MSFLKKIFPKSFDKKCMGKRYQMHYEIDICLYLKRRGWKIVYDPSIQVNHYIAPKFEIINKDKNIRDRFNYGFFVGMVHNETYYLLKNLPILRKIVFLIWSFSIGTRANFGFLQWFRFLPREGRLSTKKLLVSFEGKLKALSSWIRYLCRSQL
jgi:GT2 family glycosyltransferase